MDELFVIRFILIPCSLKKSVIFFWFGGFMFYIIVRETEVSNRWPGGSCLGGSFGFPGGQSPN